MDDHDLYLTCKLSKCNHPINFSKNDKLARWSADGRIPPVRVFALITTSARWLLRSQMNGTNTCVHVVWPRSIGCQSPRAPIDCRGRPAEYTSNKPVGQNTVHVEERAVRTQGMRCVELIKHPAVRAERWKASIKHQTVRLTSTRLNF